MKVLNSIDAYFGLMTSIIKLFILYLLTKWYGVSGYIFLFLFLRIYYIIINKIYNLANLSFVDQINILKEIFISNIRTKEAIILNNNYFEKLLKDMTEYNFSEPNKLFRKFIYKWNNIYWIKLNKLDKEKLIIRGDNLDDKINKKINIKKDPISQIFILNKGQEVNKVVYKYSYLIDEIYAEQFMKLILGSHFKNINEPSKIVVLIFEFIVFPIQIFLEIIIIIIFYIKN